MGSGEPEQPLVSVADCKTEFEAQAIAGALRAEGIDVQVVGGIMSALYGSAALPSQVLVREVDAELARALVEDMPDAAAEIDWDEVDVGDRPDDD